MCRTIQSLYETDNNDIKSYRNLIAAIETYLNNDITICILLIHYFLTITQSHILVSQWDNLLRSKSEKMKYRATDSQWLWKFTQLKCARLAKDEATASIIKSDPTWFTSAFNLEQIYNK